MNRDSPQKKKKIEIMRQLCLQRKQQNFEHLKRWDQQRASKLIIHRKIVDQIDQTLQQKLSQSTEYAKIVRQFFNDLLTQKQRYISHVIQSPQPKLQTNTVGRTIYPCASRILTKLHDSHQQTRHLNLAKRVLQQSQMKLQQFAMQKEKQLMQHRTALQLMIIEIQDSNMSTLAKCDSLVQNYNLSKTLKPFMAEKDFFLMQEEFLMESRGQLLSQRKLGKCTVEYLEFVQKMEEERVGMIKDVLGSFVTAVKVGQEGNEQYLGSLLDILQKNTEHKYIEEHFSVQELLGQQLLKQMSRIQRRKQSQITTHYLKHFLTQLTHPPFDSQLLILKTIKILIKITSKSSKQQQFQQVSLLITVDGFINIYSILEEGLQSQLQQEQQRDLMYSLKISTSLVFRRIGDVELQINVRKWGLMGFGENDDDVVKIRFNSEDHREEFVEFIAQLR